LELKRNKEIERKIGNVDKLIESIEKNHDKSQQQQLNIGTNIKVIEKQSIEINEFVHLMKDESGRINDRLTKKMVKVQILVDNLANEFKFYKNINQKAVEDINKQLNKNNLNKENIEQSFKNITQLFLEKTTKTSEKIQTMSDDI